MTIFLFILILATTCLIGYMFVLLIGLKSLIERLGLAGIVGALLVSLTMMASYQISGVFSLSSIIVGLIMMTLIMISSTRVRRGLLQLPADFSRLTHSTIRSLNVAKTQGVTAASIFMIAIGGYILATTISNLVWPISDWDAVALYDFRALLIPSEHSWASGVELGYFFHYPPFTSLLHGLSYLVGFPHAKIWYSYLFVSALIAFFGLLRRVTTNKHAILGVFLLVFSPLFAEHVTVAYTNLPYTIFFCFGTLYCLEWLKTNLASDLVLSLLLLAASTWVRQSEPFWIVPLALIFVTFLWKKRWRSASYLAAGMCLFIGIHQFWPVYVTSLNLPPVVAGATDQSASLALPEVSTSSILRNGFLVLDYIWKYLIQPQLFLLCLAVVVVIFDKSVIRKFQNKMIVGFLAFFFAMITAGTYYFSFTYQTWDLIGGSVMRMSMFTVPLLVYLVTQTVFWQPIIGEKTHDHEAM